MKFEIGERVQFIEGNEVKTGKVLETWAGKVYKVETKEGKTIIMGEGRIAKLNKPEPVVVPKFIADLIGEYESLLLGQDNTQDNVLECILQDWGSQGLEEEYSKWVDDNLIKLIDAVRNGYVVEEEPKYYVKLLATEEGYLALNTQLGNKYYAISSPYEVEGLKTKFIETEIEAIDERLWTFAVPVEEVEAE